MKTSREGGCLCGSLRYSAQGEPKRVTACHCKFCQRRSGGPLSVHAWFAEADLKLNGGAVSVYQHASDETGAWLRVHSCPKCSTSIMLTIERAPGTCLVMCGTLDEPNAFTPEAHVWTKSAPAWMPMAENAPCYMTSSGAGVLRVR